MLEDRCSIEDSYQEPLPALTQGRALKGKLKKLSLWNSPRICQSATELRRTCQALDLPSQTVDLALTMLADIKERRSASLRGEFRKAIMACCVLQAGKAGTHRGGRRTQQVVCEAFQILPRSLTSARKVIKAEMQDKEYYKASLKSLTALDLVTQHLGRDWEMKNKWQLLKRAESIEQKIKASGLLEGKSPKSLAAGVLRVLLDKSVKTSEIAQDCSVSVNTTNVMSKLIKQIVDSS